MNPILILNKLKISLVLIKWNFENDDSKLKIGSSLDSNNNFVGYIKGVIISSTERHIVEFDSFIGWFFEDSIQ